MPNDVDPSINVKNRGIIKKLEGLVFEGIT
jgi:hypothetical protein